MCYMLLYILLTADDQCLSNPCLANQLCIDLYRQYKCVCQAGYSGPDCLTGRSKVKGYLKGHKVKQVSQRSLDT